MVDQSPSPTEAPAPLDIVWGATAIAKAIGRTPRATFHMLENGTLPGAKKVAGRWCVSRVKLAQLFDA